MKSSRSQRQKMTSGEIFLLTIQTNIHYIASIIVLVFAVLWLYPDSPNLSLLQSLDTIGRGVESPTESLKIAICCNTNVDVIVNGVDVMSKLSQQRTAEDQASSFTATNHATLSSVDDVLDTFTYFFDTSSAAERHVASADVFEKLLQLVQHDAFSVRYRTGGNAALMAESLAALGQEPALYGPVGPTLRKLLHENITVVENVDGQSEIQNNSVVDEMHLILEFPPGSTWNGKRASRANRFILTRDFQNAKLCGMSQMIEDVIPSLASTRAFDAVVLSGFHLLQSFSGPELEEEEEEKTLMLAASRVSKLVGIPVHLELASIAHVSRMQLLAKTIFPHVGSLGMNEQECMQLYEALGGGYSELSRQDLVADVPSLAALTQALGFIFSQLHEQPGGRVERLHVHTFGYHVIATLESSSSWRNAKASVARGSVMATVSACEATLVSDVLEHEMKLVAPTQFVMEGKDIDINEVEPVGTWTQPLGKTADDQKLVFVYAPVMTCIEPRRTVGLGDAISSAALLPSLPKLMKENGGQEL